MSSSSDPTASHDGGEAATGSGATAPGVDAALPRLRWRTMLPLLVLAALAANALLPQIATLESAAQVLRHLRWWAVALAVLSQAASYCGYGFGIRATAQLTGDRLSLPESVMLALAAGSVGLLVAGPVGFATATFHWMRARGSSREGAILCGWLPGILNLLVLGVLTLAGMAELVLRNLLPGPYLLALVTVGMLLTALVFGIARVAASEQALSALVRRTARAWARLRRRPRDAVATEAVAERITTARRLLVGGGWRRPVVGSVANVGFDVLTLYCLFVAARRPLGPGVLLAGYGLPQLLGKVSFLPGGIGIVEGGMIGAYAALGVPASTGVLVVLAYRGVSLWLPMLIGFALAVVLEQGTGGTGTVTTPARHRGMGRPPVDRS